MEFDEMDLDESATQGGMKKFGRILAIGIILVVAGFGDVMYIQLMSAHFPGGLLMALCYVGAFTSFLAIAYMLIGKSVLFTPGLQMVIAWLIFAVELALIALNIILVFQNDGASATGFLSVWWQMAPATPVINMAGVAVLFFLDEDSKMRHEDMELAWDMKRANRRHFKALHRARMKLQNKQLDFLVTELDRAVAAPESLAAIQQTAIDLNAHLLGQLSGGRTYRTPALPTGSTVDSDPTPPSTPTPTPEKKPGWLKNPFARTEQPPVYTTPQQPNQETIQAMFRQLMEEERKKQPAETNVRVTPPNVAPSPENAPHPQGPTTEQLVPFSIAPTENGNGAKHPKPMHQ